MRRSVVRTAEIDAAFDQIIVALEQQSTRVDWTEGGAVYTQIKAWLDAHPDPDATHVLTRREMERYDKARRPSVGMRHEQGSLFQEDALLPMGNGERVRMAKAKAKDLRDWWQVEVAEFEASKAAYEAKRNYVFTRLRWMDDPEDTLLAVEMRMFGYQPFETPIPVAAMAP